MKAFYYLFTLLIAVLLLSSCHPAGFKECDACWRENCVGGQCGSCINHHCQKVCESCKGYGPNCVACWTCLKNDACMSDSP